MCFWTIPRGTGKWAVLARKLISFSSVKMRLIECKWLLCHKRYKLNCILVENMGCTLWLESKKNKDIITGYWEFWFGVEEHLFCFLLRIMTKWISGLLKIYYQEFYSWFSGNYSLGEDEACERAYLASTENKWGKKRGT